MFATVRRYEGVVDPTEAAKRVNEEFLPLISALPGFISYYWVDLGHGVMLSISVFNSLPRAIQSNEKAADWVKDNLSTVMPNHPKVNAGKVVAFERSLI